MQDPAAHNLELRDFFRSLNLEDVQHLAISIAESGREPELNATLRESSAAIPLVAQLSAAVQEMRDAGETERQRVLQGQLILLMAIFRLAEDKGYHWHSPGTPPVNISGPGIP